MDKSPDAFRTISEVADDLKLPQHVLRFWESRFIQIKPMKRAGGRRYYRPDDVDLLRGIHHLLYGEGYTIRGVQRILRDQGVKFVQTVWQASATQPDQTAGEELEGEEFVEEEEGAPQSGGLMERLRGLAPAGLEQGISRDDLRKLQAALFELGECRRLLDAAMKDELGEPAA